MYRYNPDNETLNGIKKKKKKKINKTTKHFYIPMLQCLNTKHMSPSRGNS